MKLKNEKSILVFTPILSNRLCYVLDFVFVERLHLQWLHTTDKAYFLQYSGLKCSYCAHAVENEIHFTSSEFLFETGLREVDKLELEKDIFALIFFFLSRYEEYLPFEGDKHQRFGINGSKIFSKDFFELPQVDLIVESLNRQLKEHFPEYEARKSSFTVMPTIDVDQFYLYKKVPIWRLSARIIKSFLRLKLTHLSPIMASFLRKYKDPWDVYDILITAGERGQKWKIFFLNGKYGRFDKSLSLHSKNIANKLKRLEQWHDIGIHPSYRSNKQLAYVSQEREALEKIIGKEVTISRQHYIKMYFPETYTRLAKIGIKEEYSMGFADGIGFRAGTSHDFFWYDLAEEKKTQMRIFPFSVMDVSLRNYMGLDASQAQERVDDLVQTLQEIGGTFCFIVHNESLSGYAKWKNWKPIFEKWISSF